MVAFDLTDPESLSNAKRWGEEACQHADDPLIFLVGTKKDLTVNIFIFSILLVTIILHKMC